MAERNLTKFVLVLTLCLSACASVPRHDALELADTGNFAATALQSQLNRVAATTMRQTEVQAFINTVNTCEAPAGTCAPYEVGPDVIVERSQISMLIGLRVQALEQLNAAYDALRREAQYDARGDLSSAAKGLTQTVNAYASLAGVGGLAVTGLIDALGPQAAGLFAQNKQNKRMEAANEIIGSAAAVMSDALEKESGVYKDFLDDWAIRETEMQHIMLKQGVASRADILAPIAEAIGVPMTEDAEQIIAGNKTLRNAVDAIAYTKTGSRREASLAAYQAGVAALRNLSDAHDNFANLESSDFERVMIVLSELNMAVDSINTLPD